MHIVLITPNFPPEVNAGATRQYEHCRRWVASGHQVTVITPPPNWPRGKLYEGYRNRWCSEERMDGIRVLRVWALITANEGFLLRTLSFIGFMLRASLCAIRQRHVDVLVATSPHFFAGLAGMLTRWVTRRRFVLEIRDIWPESIMAVGAMRSSWIVRLLEWLEQRMYRSADRIVTVGDGYRDQLVGRGVPPEKISVVYNGVDVSVWQPLRVDPSVRRAWGGEGKFVCAYIGTVGLAHGLEVVLQAAGSLKEQGRTDVVFWIVGEGARREPLQREAERRSLDNVIFTGQVSKQQVAEVLSNCDACLVHLRGTELFGTVVPSKIFETMAMNRPIIMGVCGIARDIVMSAHAGVAMTPDDPDSLLAAIETVQAIPDAFSNGRAYVSRYFDRNKLAANMESVLTAEGGGLAQGVTAEDEPWKPARAA